MQKKPNALGKLSYQRYHVYFALLSPLKVRETELTQCRSSAVDMSYLFCQSRLQGTYLVYRNPLP